MCLSTHSVIARGAWCAVKTSKVKKKCKLLTTDIGQAKHASAARRCWFAIPATWGTQRCICVGCTLQQIDPIGMARCF
ncbi:hypothetical protein PF006_g16816 [Phytophthora fragariae]|uniref:Uncharacterized protein n=1 Tax=Phytophthora fragariae TaxID=53985 RepID=A0A6A3T3L8_9STRA|nr:hypothetical protein PF006_g16816 [Phytophthora fragariae]KAE9209009.1 hypothetical protein PF004_g16594 [Phytophthora fragariae]KAE9324927.1 hypothetical protein PF008_g16996 [Phytophthora fragariae]